MMPDNVIGLVSVAEWIADILETFGVFAKSKTARSFMTALDGAKVMRAAVRKSILNAMVPRIEEWAMPGKWVGDYDHGPRGKLFYDQREVPIAQQSFLSYQNDCQSQNLCLQ